MAGNARVTQEYIEALGVPQTATARVTQEIIEALGPVGSTARITQEYIEVLGPWGSPSASKARVTQLYAEVLGPPYVPPPPPCQLGYTLRFFGDVSGFFYRKSDLASELVPTLYVDSVITIDNGTLAPVGQEITQDGQWIDWFPDNGPLSITFGASTIWVVTSQAKGTPPSIPVYATSKTYPPWKQTCTE